MTSNIYIFACIGWYRNYESIELFLIKYFLGIPFKTKSSSRLVSLLLIKFKFLELDGGENNYALFARARPKVLNRRDELFCINLNPKIKLKNK